ncbi:FAD-dependent monooxygenase [Agromyces seonyuensis]|uniref:FAD-dependent oxidoreductase n=1 Tax=Agromyces seonyuensis TaxID=2662446 RepID=A0A6I4P5B9_9MICO|nr:FAD-dependent oxidoreductase [Agromyces seonyuensis]
MPDVAVVGAGPVGMLLAGELARRGLDVEVLERRLAPGAGSRAIGVHAPVLAALEPSGRTEALLAEAHRVPRGEARSDGRLLGTVRFDRLGTRFPFVATLPQSATEAALAADAPAPLRGVEVARVSPDAASVRLTAVRGAERFETDAAIVVVAGGAAGRELVYRTGALARHDYRDRYLMADLPRAARGDGDTAVVHLDAAGVLESFPLPGGIRRFVAWDAPDGDPDPAARAARLRSALRFRGETAAADAVTGATAFGVRRVIAPRLRRGRLLVIGDAAHEVSPIGGQGMNLGLLDAIRLAPLLAEWVRSGDAPEPELRRWERARVASARTAARLAAANTALGRPLPSAAHEARALALRVALGPGLGRVFARAYAMGFDADARAVIRRARDR